MTEVVGYVLAAASLGLAGFFLARGMFYMLSAAADRRDKSILGTIDPSLGTRRPTIPLKDGNTSSSLTGTLPTSH